jgi:16S rRNA processing protein RimM
MYPAYGRSDLVTWASMITVGKIVRPQHNRGQVVIDVATDFPEERFGPGAVVFVERDGRVDRMTVAESRPHDARWVVGFEGVRSIDAAEQLRGLELRVPAEALAKLEPGTYYIHDLVGCEVWTVGGEKVGPVARVDGGSGVPILVIDAGGGSDEVLVPFVEAFCRRVDLAAKRIEIAPPPGLIELNQQARR